MAQYVDLGMVETGCDKIDEAINLFSEAKTCIGDASSLLDQNTLRFGGINSTLEEQLDILKTQVDKCKNMNDGVTATIRSNAQAQYEEYQAWLNEQNNKKKA